MFKTLKRLLLLFVSFDCIPRQFLLSRRWLTRVDAQDFFKPASGFHFANPIPEEFSLPKSEIDKAIDQAVQEAADQGFHGHSNTPFILARIKELTKGNSTAANRALIESNIKMATKVAVELSRLRTDGSKRRSVTSGIKHITMTQ